MSDKEDEEVCEKMKAQAEANNQLLWTLVGLYIALFVFSLLSAAFAYYRYRQFKQRTQRLKNIGENVNRAVNRVKRSETVQRVARAVGNRIVDAVKSL